jgi:GGDEF domain-containing protein
VLLGGVENVEAELISRRILEVLKQLYQVDDLRVVISASAGIAFASEEQRGATT